MIADPTRQWHRCSDGGAVFRYAPLPDSLAAVLRGFTTPRWWRRGRCYGADPEAWFPPPWVTPQPQVQRICRRCPVRAACLAHALAEGEHGIWGGVTDFERYQARQAILETGDPAQVFADLLDQTAESAPAQRRSA